MVVVVVVVIVATDQQRRSPTTAAAKGGDDWRRRGEAGGDNKDDNNNAPEPRSERSTRQFLSAGHQPLVRSAGTTVLAASDGGGPFSVIRTVLVGGGTNRVSDTRERERERKRQGRCDDPVPTSTSAFAGWALRLLVIIMLHCHHSTMPQAVGSLLILLCRPTDDVMSHIGENGTMESDGRRLSHAS